MPKYVGLLSWTDQGVRSVKDTVTRYQDARALIERMGGAVDSILWTMGPYDIVTTFEAPDDETVSAVMLTLASAGNLRGTTMRAFTADEMGAVIGKMP